MKKYNLFLVDWMWSKARRLKKVGCNVEYFNKQLEKAIMGWDENECKGIYNHLKFILNDLSGLGVNECPFCLYWRNECPFCLYWRNCDYCEYCIIMGNCKFDNSIFNKIMNFYRNKGIKDNISYNDLINQDFPNEFYKNLLYRLEKKYNLKNEEK